MPSRDSYYTAGGPLPDYDTVDNLIDVDPIAMRHIIMEMIRHIESLERIVDC